MRDLPLPTFPFADLGVPAERRRSLQRRDGDAAFALVWALAALMRHGASGSARDGTRPAANLWTRLRHTPLASAVWRAGPRRDNAVAER